MIKKLAENAREQVRREGSPNQPNRRESSKNGSPSTWDFSEPGIKVLEPDQLKKLYDKRTLQLETTIERAKDNMEKNTAKSKTKYVDAKYTYDDSLPGSEQRTKNERKRREEDPDVKQLMKKFPDLFKGLQM